jgi:hypothetical protein
VRSQPFRGLARAQPAIGVDVEILRDGTNIHPVPGRMFRTGRRRALGGYPLTHPEVPCFSSPDPKPSIDVPSQLTVA